MMRFGFALLAMLLLSGCTALAMGGGSTGTNGGGAGGKASDSTITTTITQQLRADTTVNAARIGVRTYNGSVTLTGNVANYVARDQAGIIAKRTNGVIAVNNLIVVDN